MSREERVLYGLLVAILAAFLSAGFLLQGFAGTMRGLGRIQVHPGRLLNDFTSVAGEGAALVNAALAAAIGLALVRLTRVRLSGPTVAAVFTILGFGLFGKTPANILPIFLGVFLSARLAGRRFSEYILIALFGTALGPLVTMLAFEIVASPWAGIPLAAGGGVLAGMLLPPLALVMLRLHQGYNLYNVGLTAGFLGLLVAAVVAASTGAPDMAALWNGAPSLPLFLLVPALSVLLAAAGPLLAALFGTTLAPLAGEFGPVVGFAAGFLHLAMVERTGAWHLGVNLYNNGFAGGLTATFLVAVIEWYRSNVKGRRDASGNSGTDGVRQPTSRGGGGSP